MNNENTLIPLPGFVLRVDLPWTTGFVAMVEDQLRKLRVKGGRFYPPRFFGYCFRNNTPICIGGNWTVNLDADKSALFRKRELDKMTQGQYSISSESAEAIPDFLLVHDRKDGACWLWSFNDGLRFVESHEPQIKLNT